MKNETIKKMVILNTVQFPQFYKTMDDKSLAILINTWYELFKDYEDNQITAVFQQALATAQYPVKPADIFAILDAQTKSTMPTIDELYKIASDTADAMMDYYSRDNGWHNYWGDTKSGLELATEIYDKMPPLLKEWKQSPTDLLNWYLGINYENESYIRREFEQVIKTRMARRETLGIGYNEEFKPIFDGGCLKSIADKKQIGGGK